MSCPKCFAFTRNLPGYAFSSSLLPVRCRICGTGYFLAYGALASLALWFLISPLALSAALVGSVLFLPGQLVWAGFGTAFIPLVMGLILGGNPKAKD